MDKNLLLEKVTKLQNAFREAVEIDIPQDPVETCENYKQVIEKLIYRYLNEECCVFNQRQRYMLIKIVATINKRILLIKDPEAKTGIRQSEVKILCENLQKIIFDPSYDFPINITSHEFDEANPITNLCFDTFENATVHQQDQIMKHKGDLLPKPRFKTPNSTCISICINRVNLKNAGSFIDPFIKAYISDPSGYCKSSIQVTPISTEKEDNWVIFNKEIYIQQALESLRPNDAIFFEFHHYKPSKNKISLKCFSILEKDEIKEGSLYLEIYKKPIDLKKQKLKLLDKEDRFMEVFIEFLN